MPIPVQCVSCNKCYRVAEKFAGLTVICRETACKAKIRVPEITVVSDVTLVACVKCGKKLQAGYADANESVRCLDCEPKARVQSVQPSRPKGSTVVPTAQARGSDLLNTKASRTGAISHCTECGGKVESDAKHCNHCGEKLGSASDQNQKTEEEETSSAPAENLKLDEAFNFAFKQPEWFAKASKAGFLIYFPIVGRITVRGWRLEIARRVYAGSPKPLPGFENFGNKMLHGLQLRLAWCFYQLPFLAANVFLAILPLIVLWALIQGDSWPDAKARFKARLTMWSIQVALSLALEIWGFVGQMLFWAGLVRFLQNGRWTAFFEVLSNARLVFSHFGLFVVFFIWGLLAQMVWKIIQGVLLATGLATIFVPFLTSPPWNWYRGHLWGQLARIIDQRQSAMDNH